VSDDYENDEYNDSHSSTGKAATVEVDKMKADLKQMREEMHDDLNDSRSQTHKDVKVVPVLESKPIHNTKSKHLTTTTNGAES
jgi:hypothetical protein